ncbi:uncharacterized protein LOC135224353 [Macrobrachium nipponense]|uniref:uncharacterized protein LOC135224353 n=1 Tax=Macrobrachium nipponense TaxID=159736 RepID=UPI0030C882F5
MMANDDINSKIFYVEGPEGQRVVIVPPGVPIEEKAKKLACYYCCFIFMVLMAFICLLLGSVYAGIDISTANSMGHEYGPLTSVGLIFLAICVFFIVVSIICFRRAGRTKANQVLQYMHRDDPWGRWATVARDREEYYGIGYERRAVAPNYSLSHDTPTLLPLNPTGHSPGLP